MNDGAKLMLSLSELTSAGDKSIILTKKAVMDKTAALFATLCPLISSSMGPVLREEKLKASAPKISKGENYRGFPYMILDYPAVFEKGHVFALRTMFLWGHFMSVTLHLSGRYRKLISKEKTENDPVLFIAAGKEEWEHYFGDDNFVLLSPLDETHKKNLFERDFIKIALKYDLAQWNEFSDLLPEAYRIIADKICHTSVSETR